MKVRLDNVRLAFPALFQPKSVNGEGDPRFSATFIFPADHTAVEAIQKAFDVIGKEKWGAKWPMVKKEIEGKDRTCLHDGDTKAGYAGFEGQMFVSASNKSRPLVIDRDRTPLAEVDGKPYGGCFVNASIELWAQDNNYGKRINAQLKGVQFVRDGEAFSGGASAASEEDFDDISETADDLI